MNMNISRRSFIKTTGLGSMAAALSPEAVFIAADGPATKVLNPYHRVPVSLIIDDSTCLYRMG